MKSGRLAGVAAVALGVSCDTMTAGSALVRLLLLAERSSTLPGERGSEGTRGTSGLLIGEGVVAATAEAA